MSESSWSSPTPPAGAARDGDDAALRVSRVVDGNRAPIEALCRALSFPRCRRRAEFGARRRSVCRVQHVASVRSAVIFIVVVLVVAVVGVVVLVVVVVSTEIFICRFNYLPL